VRIATLPLPPISGRMFVCFSPLLLPLCSIGLMSQFLDHFTEGRTPWTGDQPVARPLPKHRTTQTQNKRIYIPNIHTLCEIWTHDPGSRASEDSTCFRPLGYRDQHERMWQAVIQRELPRLLSLNGFLDLILTIKCHQTGLLFRVLTMVYNTQNY
jgi:hypothetical protein